MGSLLDTHVIFELRRPRPDQRVIAFIAAESLESLYRSISMLVR